MRALKKTVSVLLAIIMALSAVSISVAAEETEISAGEPAVTEEREPYIGIKEDCRIDLDYTDRVVKGDTVKMTAIGSYIDGYSETEIIPVDGDVRIIPMKWTARRVDTGEIVDSGEWPSELTIKTKSIETAGMTIDRGAAPVDVEVEVEFLRQKYENGSWEDLDSFTLSKAFTVSSEPTAFQMILINLINLLLSIPIPILVISFPFDFFGGFGPSAVSRLINIIIVSRPSSRYSTEEIIRAILEIFS